MKLSTEEAAVISAVKQYPSVSIILPVHTEISMKEELAHQLKLAVSEASRMLRKDYAEDTYLPVVEKIQSLVKDINFSPPIGSIALYASPSLAKIFYLDIAVEQKIIIDESFETRDLLYARQPPFDYLVLMLDGRHARLFLGNREHLSRIRLISPENIDAFKRDLPERVFNFSDPQTVKQNELERFLRHTDQAIDDVLKAYPLPLFLSGPEKALSKFAKISRHAIAGFVHGNFDDAEEHKVITALQPQLQKLKEEQLETIREQLTDALKEDRLSVGVSAVWTSAKQGLGKLLIVERNFTFAAEHTGKEQFIRQHDPGNPGLYISDAVDDIIETVVNKGGDVVFVPDGAITEFLRICLIHYHQ